MTRCLRCKQDHKTPTQTCPARVVFSEPELPRRKSQPLTAQPTGSPFCSSPHTFDFGSQRVGRHLPGSY